MKIERIEQKNARRHDNVPYLQFAIVTIGLGGIMLLLAIALTHGA